MIGKSHNYKKNSKDKNFRDSVKIVETVSREVDDNKNKISYSSTNSGEILTSNISNEIKNNYKERLMMRNETLLWFNSLNIGFNLQNSDEIDKLILIRQKLLRIEYNCPGYISKALRFVKMNRGQTFSKFCALLSFFEDAFVKWILVETK